MNNCPFCENNIKKEETDRILYESKNFIVFPSLGQIVEGYLLIVPKKHYISMGDVPAKLYPELKLVYNKVREVLLKNYENPIFFEHGPISQTKRGGCCIDHAHFHAVPIKVDLLIELSNNFKCKKIKSFLDIKKQFLTKTSYFYYESNLKEKYLFEIPDITPSQYIRQLIAHKIHQDEK